MTHDLHATLGANPVRLANYVAATGAGDTVAEGGQRPFPPLFPSYRSPLANLLGLRFIVTGDPIETIDRSLTATTFPEIARTPDARIYENPAALPRVLFATEARQADFRRILSTGDWPVTTFEQTVLLETAIPANEPRRRGNIAIRSYRNTEVVLDVSSPDGGWAVLNDVWHPWWRATIDGKPVPILKANVIFRAIKVPPGQHVVRFEFQPLLGAWTRSHQRQPLYKSDPTHHSFFKARAAAMNLFKTYARALALLFEEGRPVIYLALANAGIGLVQLAEPILFGAIVDALANKRAPFIYIGGWAAIGLFGIVASVVVAVVADRMAHRRRLAAMATAFDRAITLPISYHAKVGTGATIRNILAGAEVLFGTWLTFLREQFAAMTTLCLLAPLAFWMEWRLALLLVLLAVVYVVLNVLVVRRTSEGQKRVETQHIKVSGRVGDVISNVPIVQSYARLSEEANALRSDMQQLLSAQYPVLTWWGLLTVLSRAAATITMICVFALGSYLMTHGDLTVGEIVSFVGFAGLLIAKLDQLSGFVTRLFMQAPTLATFFELLDTEPDVVDDPNAPDLANPRGAVRFENVTYRYDEYGHGIFDLDLDVPAGTTVAMVGPTGAGKTTAVALLQRIRDPDKGRITIGGQDIRQVNLNSLRQVDCRCLPGCRVIQSLDRREHPDGPPGCQTRPPSASAADLAEAHDFICAQARRLRFHRGGARRLPLRR